MDNLDIKIVDSLTVNLNQEEYSTEGQVQNGIDIYVEDEQQLFEAALTQDSINLYTRETPDIINIKEITDGISKLESQIEKTSKEATLIAKVAELKEALNSIDFTTIEQAIQDVEDVTASEATLIQGVGDIIKAVENIDFTDLENSIAEVKNAVANIDFSALAKEETLTQVQSKVEEVGNKIDNIKLPEIDTTELAKESTLEEVSNKLDNINVEVDLTQVAKQGENAEATNSAIYALLSQFGDSVLQEAVTIVLNSANTIVWSDYEVTVSTSSGNRIIPISEDGTCTFSVKYGQEYSVFLPIIGSYIKPQKQTYTAQSPSKTIYWSYVISGAFGIDELGRRYTAEEIEAYTDRSFIKYIGYTDEFLESYVRDDGRVGIGVILPLVVPQLWGTIASGNIEFSQELLPFVTTREEAMLNADGETNTKYILEEATRLGVSSQLCSSAVKSSIQLNGVIKYGFIGSYIQYRTILSNRTLIQRLYELVGGNYGNSLSAARFTSNQYDSTRQVQCNSTSSLSSRDKDSAFQTYTLYPLNQ